jgi:HAD superfamily hydrolase (TIGR01662 family)
MTLSTIFFDFGGTLAKVPNTIERPWKVWVEVARDFHLNLSETLVRHALEATNEELGRNIYRYVGRTSEFWRLFDSSAMDRLRIREQREEFGRALEKVFGDPSNRELFPEVRTVLEKLKALGYHIGLISNNNDFLLKVLEYHDLNQLLDSVTYSQEVGAEKPAPEVFTKALERAHCSPSEAVHVGDSIRADVEGARRSGLQAVWLNRGHEPSSVDCLTIHVLDELAPMLELINQAVERPG